jgi:hypothetical protein
MILTWKGAMTIKVRSGAGSTTFLRLAYSAPVQDKSTAAELRRYMQPATKALPFVKLRAHDQAMWRPESYWHVKSTQDKERDVRLGRRYAHAAIAAMKADRNSALIALILQDIARVSAEPTSKRGPRTLSPIAQGFLSEIGAAVAQL